MPEPENRLEARKALNDQLLKSAVQTAILQHVATMNAIHPGALSIDGTIKFKLRPGAPGNAPEVTFETNH